MKATGKHSNLSKAAEETQRANTAPHPQHHLDQGPNVCWQASQLYQHNSSAQVETLSRSQGVFQVSLHARFMSLSKGLAAKSHEAQRIMGEKKKNLHLSQFLRQSVSHAATMFSKHLFAFNLEIGSQYKRTQDNENAF